MSTSWGDTAVGVDVDRVRACGDGVDPCGPRGRAAAWSTKLSRSARPSPQQVRRPGRRSHDVRVGPHQGDLVPSGLQKTRRDCVPLASGATGHSPPYRPERERNGPDPRGQAGVEVHHADAGAGHLARTTGLSTTLTVFLDSLGTNSASDKRGKPVGRRLVMALDAAPSGKAPPGRLRLGASTMAPATAYPVAACGSRPHNDAGPAAAGPAKHARGRAVPRPRAGREDPWSRPAVLRRDRRRGGTARVETWATKARSKHFADGCRTDTTPHEHLKRD